MKKKIFSWITLAFIILPCMLIFAACAKGDVMGYKVVINGRSFVSSTNTGVTMEYGTELDIDLYAVFENGEKESISKGKYFVTDESGLLTTALPVGTYSLVFSYGDFADIEVQVTVAPKVVAVPVFETYKYNGKEQTVEPVGFDETFMTISGNKGTVADDYTATIGLKDKVNYVWADGTTEDKQVGWTIEKVFVEQPVLTANSLVYNGENKMRQCLTLVQT